MTADSPGPAGIRPRHVEPTPLASVCEHLGVPARPGVVTGLSLASNAVRSGDLYAALPGARTHGARYAADALGAGAAAILTDGDGAAMLGETDVPVLVVERPRAVLGDLAALVYADPASSLLTIGVTGTQGKTTVTQLAECALTAAGHTPGVIGTIGTRIAGRVVRTALTTPEAPALHALFGAMLDDGVTACAMEVSSHALVQGRVDGVVFDVAVFLNLGRDHLDFHGSVEEYFAAKADLFTPRRAKRAVVNVDDEHGRRLASSTALPVTTFSTRSADADWALVRATASAAGTAAAFAGPDGTTVDVDVPLPGGFNVTNALAVVAATHAAGIDVAAVAAGIGSCPGVPGRMQSIDRGQDFQVVVDYAHKPDAVEAVLGTLRPLTEGRLIVVIGAGGDRDTGKRPVMGEIASRLADVVVVTDDNPRSEEPAAIRRALLDGAARAESPAWLLELADRGAAIDEAVALARTGDCVVIAGKGHEQGQEVAGRVHPFDDARRTADALDAVVREAGR